MCDGAIDRRGNEFLIPVVFDRRRNPVPQDREPLMLARLTICLLLSFAAGAAVYLAGAIVWCLVDPLGAGQSLMVTLPLALTAAAAPAMLGVLGMINSNGWRQNARAMPEARRQVAATPTRSVEQKGYTRPVTSTAPAVSTGSAVLTASADSTAPVVSTTSAVSTAPVVSTASAVSTVPAASPPRPDRREPRDRLRRVGLGRIAPAGVPDTDEEIVTA